MTELALIGTYLSPGDSIRWRSLETDFIFNQIENELIIPMGLLQSPPLTIPSTPTPLSSVLSTTGLIFYKKLYEIASTLEMQPPLKPCVPELLNQFVAPQTFIPTNYTKNADEYSSALELILQKYRDWKQRNRVQHVQNLPSFDSLSDEQQMFLQFGALMCSSAGENVGSLHEAM
uniref:Uncharacterized protein n=1 Tax=Panagrolaimus sp. ES5 TaxID=591445 RepID=A0AC34G263_9BILA